MDRDGSNRRQVTKESFRLVNSPAWLPDGEYIVARKHYTATRSLGAGEMWLYHRSGGEGLQMTKKPNDQKDAGEPAFSPDGRYLYYSQDTTPGPTFEYNKDPNGEIYVIQRLDRQKGETEPFINGPGGAIRPTPSPDGRFLAFVRRVRAKSVLFVQNLESGANVPLYDGLDRDLQETWAIHGVYPRMAWTPDSRSLVFWAGGKLHRIEVAGKKVSQRPVPRHARRRRSPRPCASPSRSRPSASTSRCCAGCRSRRRGTGSSTRRSASSGSRTCRTAHRSGSRARRTTWRSSPRSRATAARSSTPPGTTRSWARCGSSPPAAARGG